MTARHAGNVYHPRMSKKRRTEAARTDSPATTLPARELVITTVPIDQLKPDPKNARTHDETNLAAIAGSLGAFGQVEPLLVQKGTGRIIGGHGRLETMKRMGETHAQVVELDITDEKADALNIALNRTAELAGWHNPTLIERLQELPPELAESTGFGAAGLKALIAAAHPPQTAEDEPPAPLPKAVSKTGDLWLLGDHRLLCGSSTSDEDVARVMAGERAALFATDPPYLVGYTGMNHPGTKVSRARTSLNKDAVDYGKTWDDHDANSDLYAHFIACAQKHAIAKNAAWYCWHASKRQAMLEAVWEKAGAFVHQQVIWVKTRPVLTRSNMLWQHEPCFLGWAKGRKDVPIYNQVGALVNQHEPALHGWKQGDRPPVYQRLGDYVSTVWQIPSKEIESDEHPTSKPVRIFGIPMELHTKEGEVCYEPFSGSGSQIIAGEHLRRRVRAIEIEPRYVDVAVRRWQTLTGKEATLEATGETWEATAAARDKTRVTKTRVAMKPKKKASNG